MTITNTLARSYMAPMFISDAMEAVRHPQRDVDTSAGAAAAADIASRFGVTADPLSVARVNGAVQVAAASLLALGRAPRVASTVLALSLTPNTIARSRLWAAAQDPEIRSRHRAQLVRDLALLGGLLLVATGRDGGASRRRPAERASRRAPGRVSDIVTEATHAVTDHAGRKRRKVGTLRERAAQLASTTAGVGERTVQATEHLAAAALTKAERLVEGAAHRLAS